MRKTGQPGSTLKASKKSPGTSSRCFLSELSAILLLVVAAAATAYAFYYGAAKAPPLHAANLHALFYVVACQCGFLGFTAALLGYRFTHRFLPNLAIAVAWVILGVICFDALAAPAARVTIVDLLVDAYARKRLSGSLLETLLKFYGIGFFGTVLVSLGPEIAKGIWSDEVRSTDNKSLPAKFKRDRRQILLRVVTKRGSFSWIYLRLLIFVCAFALVLILVLVRARGYKLVFEAYLLLMMVAASLEAAGVFSHALISDHALISSEKSYLRRRRNRLSAWLAEESWSESEQVNAYFTVLIHTYCNHGLTPISHADLFPAPVPPEQFAAKGQNAAGSPESKTRADDRNLLIALELIRKFDYNKAQYIDPIEEQYWVKARQAFEPAFALDVERFLFSEDRCAEDGFPQSELQAIALARDCFFTAERERWEDWLYTSGIAFETMRADLMLCYLRMKYLKVQNPPVPDAASSSRDKNADFASLLLEFPYDMEACIRKHYGLPAREAEAAGRREPDYFHLFVNSQAPKYRDRVEQYYANLYLKQINGLDASLCNQVAKRFADFLTDVYEDGNRTERYLHRILPINSNNFRATHDVSKSSILFRSNILVAIAASGKDYCSEAPGWQAIVRNNIQQYMTASKQARQTPRLCLYDRKDRVCRYRAKRHDVGRTSGYCCVSRAEQCEGLASILFEAKDARQQAGVEPTATVTSPQ